MSAFTFARAREDAYLLMRMVQKEFGDAAAAEMQSGMPPSAEPAQAEAEGAANDNHWHGETCTCSLRGE